MSAHAVASIADPSGRPDGAPGRPLRVALVLPSLMVGGAEHHVAKLCRALDRRVVEPCIILLRRELPHELGSLVPSDVPVVTAPFSRRDPRLISWLAGQFRSRHVEVAQSFLWYADAIAAAAALLVPRVRLVCSERGDRSTEYHIATRRAFDRLVTFRRAAELTANSRFGAALLVRLGAPASRVSVIANGIDIPAIDRVAAAELRDPLGWPASAYLVGSVSRQVAGKGLETLIQAIGLVRDADVRAVLIGDGPLRPALEALTLRLGLHGRVAFLGQRTPATPLLKACDCAVQLSRESEHCSNSILEAMACGLPVVATAVGGNPELVADDRTGILVPPADPESLAAALARLAGDRAAAAEMGLRARDAAVHRYSMASVAAEFTGLWRAAAARR